MIQPVAYRTLLEGKSNSHLIHFSDGRDYVVKYVKPGFEKTLPNEWVAYCLARFLGLPVPYSQLVAIPPDFSDNIPELRAMHYTSKQFASEFLSNCVDLHQVSDVQTIVNHRDLAGIILFDYWLCNPDRTRKNVLLREETPDAYRLWIIDQAEIFGSYGWYLPQLESLPIGLMQSATHGWMAEFIENERDFTEFFAVIQSIPRLMVEEITSLIPDDWPISAAERNTIVHKLMYRRDKHLPYLMSKFINKVYRKKARRKT